MFENVKWFIFLTEGRNNRNKKVHFAGDDEVDEVHYDEEHMSERSTIPHPLMDTNMDADMPNAPPMDDDDDDDGEPMTMQKRLLKLAGHDPVFKFFFHRINFTKINYQNLDIESIFYKNSCHLSHYTSLSLWWFL